MNKILFICVSAFILLATQEFCAQKPINRADIITIKIPRSLAARKKLDCFVATDFADKTALVRKGMLFIGSFNNPSFRPIATRSMKLLNNQKYAFLFIKPVAEKNETDFVTLATIIPHKQLAEMVSNKKAIIPLS